MTYIICAYDLKTDVTKEGTVRVTNDLERALIHVRSFLVLGYTVKVIQDD